MGMKFGLCLPHRWVYASPQSIAGMAWETEVLGYHFVWVADHIPVPAHHSERAHIFYEALATFVFFSALITRVQLGTNVLIASTHQLALLAKQAKQLATPDWLSGGCLIVGVGVG